MIIGIIITGIIEQYFLEDLISVYKNCNCKKIISTWDYTEQRIIDKLKQNGFNVVQSEFPNDIEKCSVNFQNYSFKIGLEKAKELSLTHVLRMRGDMFCNDINKLLEIYKEIYETGKMIFLLYFLNRIPYYEYLIDHIHFGDVYMSERYACCIRKPFDKRFPEKFRQEECFGTGDYDIIKNFVIFSSEELIKNNIELKYMKIDYLYLGNVIKLWHDENLKINQERKNT
jgi:hypothetical protein